MAAVRGTRFRVNASAQTTWTEVLEGAVDVSTAVGQVQAGAGYGTVAQLGQAPVAPRALLAAPDLSVLPQRLERLPDRLAFDAGAWRRAVSDPVGA